VAERVKKRLPDQGVRQREGFERTMVAVKGQCLDPRAQRPHAAMAVGVTNVERVACGDAAEPPVRFPARLRHLFQRAVGFLLVGSAFLRLAEAEGV
jgi:hypothetical protein